MQELYRDIWDAYCNLNAGQQTMFRREVILYLSRSRSSIDTERVLSLLRQIPGDALDNDLQAAAVLAPIRLGDIDAAVAKFKTGLAQKGLSGGLHYLMADLVSHGRWSVLLSVWLEHFAAVGEKSTDATSLCQLQSIPGLGMLYLSFEKYVEAQELGSISNMIKNVGIHSKPKPGLHALRRKLVEAALRQPCPPKQAAVMLAKWADCQLYECYILRMLDKWKIGSESKANLVMLSEIYQKYGALPGAKPSIPLLRGMFDLYFPANAAGLEGIYRDWHMAWGDLDQWGFERFLKFYARAGDEQAVRDLWARYVTCFPDVLKQPRAFRSTMNVFAQTGNVDKAEEELEMMMKRYGVKPDIDIWNTLLKCYTRAEDFSRVLRCFEEIRAIHRPNSFTYAHVMAMAAKKGDLETTLDFFKRSQNDQVQVTKEMAMALVMAYCRNDRLTDAERICTELAERKATSTGIWNQLLHFNGVHGKLSKCYELLQAMKTYGVEWDHQTHEFLLQALVRVDQIQPAYHLLRSAYEDKFFPLGPEHYAVVMAGAVRTGELALVETLLWHMQRAGLPVSFNAHVSLVEAAFRQNPSAERTRRLGKEFVEHLRALLPTRAAGSPKAYGDVVEIRRQTQGIGRAIMLLVELRDFGTAEELVNIYSELFANHKGQAGFPPAVASALMLGYLKDARLGQVQTMWERTWESVLARSHRVGKGAIYPAHQYDLARPFGIVVRAFREANDGIGLVRCVEKVTSAGFKLTRSNWNMAVRYLAEMGHWEQAMNWCETMLMPQWRGWNAKGTSLQERRDMKNTRILQASKPAIYGLQKEWLKLRKLAAWSAQISRKLKQIELRHPMLHYAFITSDHDQLAATWVLPKKESLTQAIKELLKPISYAELKVMRKALERQLRLLQTKSNRPRKTHGPFHVVTGGSSTDVRTRPVVHRDLRHLDAAVRSRLMEIEMGARPPAADADAHAAEKDKK
ncbi:hypothetical protein RJ55_06537 [Drechmeria coniospora]|nr:hypothetical protein RJ55_06537 [Drechmeria coniospora]